MLYRDPVLYDAIYDSFEEDIPFYRELALGAAGPTCELACGSGRVTVPLACAGIEITGVDNSPEMITAARERARRAGRAGGEGTPSRRRSPRFVLGDMRDAVAFVGRDDPPFGLVLIPLHSLSHLLSTADALRCLRAARRVLHREGTLALAVHNPDPEIAARDPSALYEVCTPGHILESTRYDAERKVLSVRWWVDELTGARATGPTPLDFELRMFSPGELQLLLRRAGFRITARYGWYDRAPFVEESGTQVVVATVA